MATDTIPAAATAVPVAAAPDTLAPAAVPATAPPEERELLRVQMSMLRRYPGRFVGYVLGTFAAAILSAWAFSNDHNVYGTALIALAGFLALRFAYWCGKANATSLLVTNRRVLLESGLLARQASEFTIESVADIQVDQGVLGRLLNVGDLVIVSVMGEEKRQMVMLGVLDPLGVAEHIRAAKGS